MHSIVSGILKVDLSSMAYSKTGAGNAVVLIHGIGGHKEDWADCARALSGSRTVYTIDMLGFGESSKDAALVTIADQVSAIIALLDAEGIEKADVVGNSVGGWVAATLAATHPARVDRLVLVDAAGFKAMFDGPPPVNFYPTTRDEMKMLLQHVRFDPSTHTDDFAEIALAASGATGDAKAAEAVGNGMFVSDRLEDVADKVAAPTLILWGAEDRLFPPQIADLVASHIDGATVQLIPMASHFPQLDNPVVFNAAVAAFLER